MRINEEKRWYLSLFELLSRNTTDLMGFFLTVLEAEESSTARALLLVHNWHPLCVPSPGEMGRGPTLTISASPKGPTS